MKKYFYLLLLVFSFNIENFVLAKDKAANNINIYNSINDEEITNQVILLLKLEKDIPQANIKIITKNGVVGIYGNIETKLQANKIIELVSSINNVIDVNTDRLEIKNSKEFLSDAFITAKARGRIKFLAVRGKIQPGYQLHLETTNCIIHIFGTVQSHRDIATIKNSVLDIIDVKHVKMNVKCK